jgi:ketosteroid isomerase-like protein
MSRENVEALRGVYTQLAQGNLRAGAELFAPDISYEPLSVVGHEATGLGEVQDVMREFVAQWKDFRVEAREFEDLGDTILVTEHQSGTGRASGVEIDQIDYAAWTFRDGLVTRVRWRMDPDDALDTAELSEQ